MNEYLKKEASKQLVGIKITLWINIIIAGIYTLVGLIGFFTSIFDYYDSSYVAYNFFVLLLYGGLLLFLILTLIGLNKGYRYSMITTRVHLVLSCFTLVGLILVLAIFWRRLNLPEVQQFLHYGHGKSKLGG